MLGLQETKELKDAAKRAGKKAKDEFKEKEAGMLQRHDNELRAQDRSVSEAPSEPASDGTAADSVLTAGSKVQSLHSTHCVCNFCTACVP